MTSPAPSPEPAKGNTSKVVAVSVVGAVLLICLISVFVNMARGDEPGSESIMAEIMCEEFIEDQLVSPATAEYEHETTFADPMYTVVGTVDSENALGAMIRSEYTCVVEPTEGDQWRLESLDIE